MNAAKRPVSAPKTGPLYQSASRERRHQMYTLTAPVHQDLVATTVNQRRKTYAYDQRRVARPRPG